MDFSYHSYGRLLDLLIDSGYKFSFIMDDCRTDCGQRALYLRHDVDTDYLGCIPLAQIEASKNVHSTWYFLFTSDIYNVFSPEIIRIMKSLVELGHVVGLHVDATQYSSIDEMENECNAIFELLSKHIDVSKTLSFHKPAQWLLDQSISIHGWTNAYSRKYYSDSTYVSDSNRREFWKEDRLPRILNSGGGESACLLFHPLWWHEHSLDSDEVFCLSQSYLGSNRVGKYLSDCCKKYTSKHVEILRP